MVSAGWPVLENSLTSCDASKGRIALLGGGARPPNKSPEKDIMKVINFLCYSLFVFCLNKLMENDDNNNNNFSSIMSSMS